ncbi:DNA2/NAM7 family helicase [Hymenobacter sp. DH14]|uniref:DNA2/NAM7 family helicase n=1 Tax=Hymenobacter cyanobacteriorum TaxID=2926463 RepID=A0A9X1VH20_9BACT|nr:AAA domain-containing protein [Hymenobacter cyanobacteriorum]MCI1188731.1 DNA2/NAM7 family helicase [Hymenobacter cyanobacteriorum]
MSTISNQLVALSQQFRRFHEAEHQAQQKAIREVWALPLAARVRKGSAIANVSLQPPTISEKTKEQIKERLLNANIEPTEERIRNNFNSMLAFSNTVPVEVPVNNSNFKVGSYVLLHQGDPFDEANAFPLEISRDSGRFLTLDYSFGRSPRSLAPSKSLVLDAYAPDMRKILDKAIERLAAAPTIGALADVFLHKGPPDFDESRRVEAMALANGLDFNPRQREAFINAFSARNYYLVQGPPGTGKTWVLAHIATALARSGQRVLVTSSNHRGINNALRKIQETTSYSHLIKVGDHDDADGLGQVPNHYNCPDLKPIAGEAFIVGATCFALWTRRLEGVKFDVIIADEASQLTQLQGAAAMLTGSKYVFIGDHQQMPPIITAEHTNPEYCKSVFEYLFDFAPGTTLNTTYRMNAAIADYSSRRFYGGDLQSHSSAATRTLVLANPSEQYADVLDPAHPSVFVDLRHTNLKNYERSEAHYIADMIAELLASGVPAHEIAVVSPYRAQGRVIQRQLNKRCSDIAPDELAKITIDTVERMQGQERDVVFLSLTSGKFDTGLQRASFYFMPNRLNVAITRARVKRIVIGSSRIGLAHFESSELQQWADHFREFIESCHQITRLKPLKKNH